MVDSYLLSAERQDEMVDSHLSSAGRCKKDEKADSLPVVSGKTG